MSTSLATCLKRLSKVIDDDDRLQIIASYNDYLADDMKPAEAAVRSIDDLIAEVEAERAQVMEQVEGAGGVTPAAPEFTEERKPVEGALVDAFEDFFANPDNSFKTITEARKFAGESGFEVVAGTQSAKDMEEAMELALVRASRRLIQDAAGPVEAYDALADLYQRQPKLGTRTAKSMADQAYSTPAPLAFAVQNLINVGKDTLVYEPTAGNGALVTAATPGNVIANEIDPIRNGNLKSQGFKRVTNTRLPGSQPAAVANNDLADVVVMNPPFGAVKGSDGKSVQFPMGPIKTTQIDHAIVMNALEAMPDNGRAALIIGSVSPVSEKGRKDAYNAAAKRKFYYQLFNDYKVKEHFTVSGDLYQKQGAGYPVDIIIIDGRGKSGRDLPAVTVPPVINSWAELKEKIDGSATLGTGFRADKSVRDVPVPAGGEAITDAGPGISGQRAVESGSEADRADVSGERDAGLERTGSEPGQSGDLFRPADTGELDVQGSSDREGGIRGKLSDRSKQRAARESKRSDTRAGAKRTEVEDTGSVSQADYLSASDHGTLDTLIPANIQNATENALVQLEAQHGPVDQFVARELKYEDPEKMQEYFAAEQVDAIAMALHQIQRGKAIILGDQTGIGKGRVNAALMRYAMIQGLTPVSLTEKPNLYGDTIRDLNDTGIEEYLGRPVKPFLTNAGAKVPVDQEAIDWWAEMEDAKESGKKRPKQRGKFLRGFTSEKALAEMRKIAKDGLGDYDIVFTTYDQLKSKGGKDTQRRQFIRQIIPNALVTLDESHNAFGSAGERQPAGAADNVAQVVRKLADEAAGVMFSSATYAKRPDGMDLYARTDLGDAVENVAQLGEVITKGGLPMQQVVASMLSEAGQYIRREKSFDGIKYDVKAVDVDTQDYDTFSEAMASIAFSEQLLQADPAYEGWIDDLAKEGAGTARDSGVGKTGVESVNFTSLMHNIISQYLLGAKAAPAAERAIASLKRGEKPVITLDKTNESFLTAYMDENNLEVGDTIDATFRDVVGRYLDRIRRVTVKMPDDTTQHREFPIEMMTDTTQDAIKRTRDLINKISDDLPLSPIDKIISMIEDAGYSISEITGRQTRIIYGKDGTATIGQRKPGEISAGGRRVTLGKFNSGNLDVLLLNRAGSTGLSAHASKTFKDQRPRHMIIAQAESNIDTHMQMLGRINRSGQEVVPSYEQLAASIPAEARPAAVLAKKMASLSANTTGAAKSDLSGKTAVDFMNKYGDEVVWKVLEDNPDWYNALVTSKKPSKEDFARKVTGRLVFLPMKQQQEFLDLVTSEYLAMIEMKDRLGENDLEAKFQDLKAEFGETITLKPKEGDSPFQEAVQLREASVLATGKAYTGERVAQLAAAGAGMEKMDSPTLTLQGVLNNGWQRSRDRAMEVGAEQQTWFQEQLDKAKTPESKDKVRTKNGRTIQRWEDMNRMLEIGNPVQMKVSGEDVYGVVIAREDTKKAQQPMAYSNHVVTIAVPTTSAQIKLPMSRFAMGSDPEAMKDDAIVVDRASGIDTENLLKLFDSAAKGGRETRYIITGNIVAGFDATGARGQIINFSDSEGNIQPGIMMSRQFEPDKFMESRAVKFKTPEQVIQFMDKTMLAVMHDSSDIIRIRKMGDNYAIEMPKSRRTGGKYFLDPRVRDVAQDGFAAVGDRMRWQGTKSQAKMIMGALQDVGATFETRIDQDVAQEIMGQTPAKQRFALRRPERPSESQRRGVVDNIWLREREKMSAAVEQAFEQVLGRTTNLKMIESFPSMFDPDRTTEAMYETGVIWMAMENVDDPIGTLYHESIHALKDYGAFTPAEWQILQNASQSRWMEQYGVRDLYEQKYRQQYPEASDREIEEMLMEEGIAFAFQEFRRTGQAPSGRIRAIFEKLLRLLERIKNLLQQQGFQSPEDIMADIRAGEMARRVQERGGPTNIEEQPNMTGRYSVTESLEEQPDPDKEVKSKGAGVIAQLADKVGLGPENRATLRRLMEDEFIDVKKFQQALEKGGTEIAESVDVYLAHSAYRNRRGAASQDMHDEVIDFFDKVREAGVTYDDLNDFYYADHAPERNARIAEINPEFADGGGSGMTNEEAQQIKDDLAAAGKLEFLENVARPFMQDMNQKSRLRLYKEGLLSRPEFESWSEDYANYVPLRGWEHNPEETNGIDLVRQQIEDGTREASGAGYNVKGPEAHPALGRRSKADDPLAYAIYQWDRAIMRSEKNKVNKTLLRHIRKHPNKAMWEVNKKKTKRQLNPATGIVEEVQDNLSMQAKNVLQMKVAGEKVYITVKDPLIARNLTREPKELGAIIDAAGAFTRFLSRTHTAWHPPFVLVNAIRDAQTTWLHLADMDQPKIRRKVFRNWRKALGALYRQAEELTDPTRKLVGLKPHQMNAWDYVAQDFREAGGTVSFADLAGLGGDARSMAKLKKQIERDMKQNKSPAARAGRVLRWVADRIENANTPIENAFRLSAFAHRAYKTDKNGDLIVGADGRFIPDGTITVAKAADEARELTVNFSRRGEWTTAANSFYMFLNASLQGSVNVGRRMAKSRAVQTAIGSAAVLAMGLDWYNLLMGGEDEDGVAYWDKVPDFVRHQNIVIFEPNGSGRYWTLPMPWGYNVVFTAGQNLSRMSRGAADWDQGIWETAALGLSSFNPLGAAPDFLHMISPTLLSPITELTLNENWLGRAIMPESYDSRSPTPDSQRYFDSVWAPLQWTAQTINALTGGNEVRSGEIDVSPETIEHLLEFIVGSTGKFLTRSVKSIQAWDRGEDLVATGDTPIIRRFVSELDRYEPYWVKDKYWEVSGAVRTAEKEMKLYKENGDAESFQHFREKNKIAYQLIGTYKKTEKYLRKLRAQRRAITASNLPDEAKRAQRKENEDAQRRVRQILISRYIKLVNEEKAD